MSINLEMRPKRNDSTERFIKRFIKKVKKEKILEKYKEKMRYRKPSDIRREKKKRARRKQELERLKFLEQEK